MTEVGFIITGDDDVIVGLAVQAGTHFDGDRPFMKHRLALSHKATRQRIPKLRRKRRYWLGGGKLLLRRRLSPGAILRGGGCDRAIELRDQPSEPIEVILQAPFGIDVGMVQDSQRAAVTARPDLSEDGEVEVPRPQRLNLLPLGFAVSVHAVQV